MMMAVIRWWSVISVDDWLTLMMVMILMMMLMMISDLSWWWWCDDCCNLLIWIRIKIVARSNEWFTQFHDDVHIDWWVDCSDTLVTWLARPQGALLSDGWGGNGRVLPGCEGECKRSQGGKERHPKEEGQEVKWESESLKIAIEISLAGVAKGFSIYHFTWSFCCWSNRMRVWRRRFRMCFVIFSSALLWIDLTVSQLRHSSLVWDVLVQSDIVTNWYHLRFWTYLYSVQLMTYGFTLPIWSSFWAVDLLRKADWAVIIGHWLQWRTRVAKKPTRPAGKHNQISTL